MFIIFAKFYSLFYSLKGIHVMNEFDLKASDWDENPVHHARSEAIAKEMLRLLPIKKEMRAMEYGSGTGILSFMLKDFFNEIVLMDSSIEMVKVTNKKIETTGVLNLKPVVFDLEHETYTGKNFNMIFSQMVLHHVHDVENLIGKFYKMLDPDGFLVIADLYSEDGSFHGEGFNGHNGFNIDDLSSILRKCGFQVIAKDQCFVIERKISEQITKKYPVFLLAGIRKQ
jgi:tRNA (cmo5U34)-methyltransferase